jgi:DNA polymerase-4
MNPQVNAAVYKNMRAGLVSCAPAWSIRVNPQTVADCGRFRLMMSVPLAIIRTDVRFERRVAMGAEFWSDGHRRIILHSDMNCFYANVECLHHPELRDKPVAVGGREEDRHGIVLAKNQIAKERGVKTGEVLWQAREKCPGLVVLPPDYSLYLRFSRLARAIYYDYTDQVEPFGPDEAWLDVTGSVDLWGGDPYLMADEISERIKAELGVTVSVGVSWNKIFAKFGSDYRKPDAITVVSPDNYRRLVWDAPVRDLLYVGPARE